MSKAIQEMFDRISGRYDMLDHVLSARRDLAWRRKSVDMLPKRRQKILDLCGGTGDFLNAAHDAGVATSLSRVADFSFGMMSSLPAKGLPSGIQADALKMPFKDASFDSVLCGFGMRNLDDLALGVDEVARVVKPGGMFLTLEFFRPSTLVAKGFYGVVAPVALPLVAKAFGSNRDAYEYLVRSTRGFVPVQGYAELLGRKGFRDVRIKSFDFGICYAVAATRS